MGLIGVQVNWIKMLDCEMTVFNCWPWSLSWQYTVPVNCWGNLTIEMQSNLPTVDLQSYIAIALDNIKATRQDQHLCIVSIVFREEHVYYWELMSSLNFSFNF